jgi:periplasmic copper chaperone A
MIRSIHQHLHIACLAATSVFFVTSPTSAHEKPAAHRTSTQAIEHVMKAQFDKPEAPLTVVPITVEGDYAIAGWIQKDRGGRALLKAEGGKWTIRVCAGDGLLQVPTLEMAGVSGSTAKRLVEKVAAAERRLPVDHVKKFSLFEGLLKIEAGSHHGHGHTHGSEHRHQK